MTSPAATTVLIVEDDPNIVDLLRSNLVVRGYAVVVSTDGADALELAQRHEPDLALVDLMLPKADGFELCRQLREQFTMGIVVVSARGREDDKVRALNLGADDYLTKPFGIEELFARIGATLRRSRPAPVTAAHSVIRFGAVHVDLDDQLVTVHDQPVRLTPTEFALLRELVTNPNRLLTHGQLLQRVWGAGYATETEYIRAYVRRLRAKLEDSGGSASIVTEPRRGYRFVPEPPGPG